MPAASNSRRHRRQNSEDIEVDKPTQSQQADDVESDDEEAPARSNARRGTKVKAEKGKGKKKEASDDEGGEEGGEESSDDEVIDVDNWTDQPIDKDQAKTVQGLAIDWNSCDNIIRQNWEVLAKIGVGLVDSLDEVNKEEPKEVQELDAIFRELVDISARFGANKESLTDLYQQVSRGDISNARELYKAGVAKRIEEYNNKTTRQKYSKVQEYVEFKSTIYDAIHPGEPMPPLTNFIKKEPGDDDDSDDELEIGGQTQDYKCPLSLTLLTDPVTSTVCGHSYSAIAIRESFQGHGSGFTIACPTAGCKKRISAAQCKPNPQLAKKVKDYKRRIERQEAQEHSDAESIVD